MSKKSNKNKYDDVVIYYLHHEPAKSSNSTFACVCLGRDSDGAFSRGVAICDVEDSFEKREGRKRAYARLQRAMGRKRNCFALLNREETQHESAKLFYNHSQVKGAIAHKSGYNVKLTDFEKKVTKKLVEGPVKTASE